MEQNTAKSVLRTAALRKRKEMARRDRTSDHALILQNLLQRPEYIQAGLVCSYLSLPDEVDTTMLLSCSFGSKRIVVPKVGPDGTLQLFSITALDQVLPGAYGIPEPISGMKEVLSQSVDVFIIPGVAFDRCGGRIGFGYGYYDAMLSGIHVPKIGLAYSWQLVPDTFMQTHDIRVNLIITEKEVIEIW